LKHLLVPLSIYGGVPSKDDKNDGAPETVSNMQENQRQLLELLAMTTQVANASQQPVHPTPITKPGGESAPPIQLALSDDKSQVPQASPPVANKSPRQAKDISAHQSALLGETVQYVTLHFDLR
jgi:hypothetical protein